MASDVIYIDVTGIRDFAQKLKAASQEIVEKVDKVLDANAIAIATKAKELCPVNLGGLHNAIEPDLKEPLRKHITVNAFYAAYVEFGTGHYAAQYVSSLPANWQQFAAQFRGRSKGSLEEFFQNMIKWVRSKGIHGVTAGGRRRTGKKAEEDIYNIAYVLVIRILRHGIKQHPFLYPAYESRRAQIISDVEAALKS
jgi:phage protein, HK97 gp10 family